MDFSSIEPGKAVAVDWTLAEYLADRECESSSRLRLLADDPELYYRTHVTGELPASASTRSQLLGTLVHVATLEPEAWVMRCAPPREPLPGWIGTKADWLRNRARAIKVAELGGYAPLDASDEMVAVANLLAGRIGAHPFASQLLGLPGSVEHTVIWREPEHGTLIRVRIDKVVELADGGLAVLELKTTGKPRPEDFAREINKYGYHVQAALYVDALRALHPGRDVIFGFIAAGTSAPWKVAAWPLADRAIERGRAEYRQALADLADRRESGDWREPWETDLELTIDLPAWAYKGHDQ